MPEVNFIIVVLLYEGVDGALRAFVKHVDMCMYVYVCSNLISWIVNYGLMAWLSCIFTFIYRCWRTQAHTHANTPVTHSVWLVPFFFSFIQYFFCLFFAGLVRLPILFVIFRYLLIIYSFLRHSTSIRIVISILFVF